MKEESPRNIAILDGNTAALAIIEDLSMVNCYLKLDICIIRRKHGASWKGYKIAKGQDDLKKIRYYADGIRKVQKELGLEVDIFPNLGLYG